MNYYQYYNQGNPNESQYRISSTTDKEKLMRHIQELTIEKRNYNLYLDIYPEDQQAINTFNDYSNKLNIATEEYEKLFGPITLESANLKGTTWQWLTAPWPWDNQRRM